MSQSKQSPEYLYSEKPTIHQLKQLGWQYLPSNTENLYLTERENFQQVLLTQRLKKAIKQMVVIECKSPTLNEPLSKGIGDLLKYSNQRNSSQPEGIEKLFYYNLLLIAASQNQAVAGTVGSSYGDYIEWTDTTPYLLEEIATKLGVKELNSRQKLIAGMLTPSNLLDILYNFTLFNSIRKLLTLI